MAFHQGYEEDDGVYDWMLRTNRNLKRIIKMHLIDVSTEIDRAVLREVYEPYQEDIDIDELGSKHYNLIGINETSAATRKKVLMDDEEGRDIFVQK